LVALETDQNPPTSVVGASVGQSFQITRGDVGQLRSSFNPTCGIDTKCGLPNKDHYVNSAG
jgi:hypothetical protein